MAKLEQLRPNLLHLPEEEALVLFAEYVLKREKDIQEVILKPKGKAGAKKKSDQRTTKKKRGEVSVTPSQLSMLQKLGLL